MSKRINKSETDATELLPNYDFGSGVRGKHNRAYQRGHRVTIHRTDGKTVVQNFKLEEGAVVLAQDVRKFFPDSDSVNDALRAYIAFVELMPGSKALRPSKDRRPKRNPVK